MSVAQLCCCLQVRRAVREGSGPFAPPKRLARHASFAWDTQRPGTPGSPNIGFFSNRSQVCLLPLGS